MLQGLLSDGNTEAALIAAQRAGARPFAPDLYAQQDDREAYQLFRIACRGGAGARQQVEAWLASMRAEAPSGETPVAVRQGENLLTNCKD